MNGNIAAAAAVEARALASRHADALREQWQARLLGAAQGRTFAVACTVLANAYYEAFEVLLRVTFPGFVKLELPVFSGSAHITMTGHVVCAMIDRRGQRHRNVQVYDRMDDLIKEFRDLADRLKFNDTERLEMFAAVRGWVTADHRVQPAKEK